jgi:hypothetical protein
MSLYYSHTLIAKPKDFAPTAAQVQVFMTTIAAQGVIGGQPAAVLRTPSSRISEVLNPVTGELEKFIRKDHKNLRGLDEVAEAIGTLHDYEIEVGGYGTPRMPPLPIECATPYHVGVTCHVCSTLRCTSDLHVEPRERNLPRYGEPWNDGPENGFFSNPHNAKTIKVPHAGCARFWIEFQLGKFLFPRIKDDDLELLNRDIVVEAEQIFGISFVQGCYWG